ncbi:MAG: hypothetical protein EOO37_03575 [Cytophagaceae bacterium]|nr:MAG: hypothetical protein EOO37_03575 [Cytophagaceae bacterium]
MRIILLLLVGWVLSESRVAAQSRPAGPWRVVSQPVRYKLNVEWGGAEEWGNEPLPTTKADTTTAVRVQRKLYRVPWNVHPDSITLFLDCQNPLTISQKQLAAIRFTATGATVRPDAKQHLLLLVPSASVVVLWAYQGKQLVFRHEFKCVPPPPPTIKCFAPPCGVSCKPSYQEYMRTVTLRAIPAIDFAEILPEDARYRVARFRATLLRQGKAVALSPGQLAAKTVQGPQGDMSDLTSSSQLGDQLQIDIMLVQRLNALGVITEVPVTKQFIVDGLKCPPEQE